jgi:hypothetical protein
MCHVQVGLEGGVLEPRLFQFRLERTLSIRPRITHHLNVERRQLRSKLLIAPALVCGQYRIQLRPTRPQDVHQHTRLGSFGVLESLSIAAFGRQ